MKVKDVMTLDVRACASSDTLRHVAELMAAHECGFIPVVAADGELEGVVTDRDVALTAYREDKKLSAISVRSAMSSEVVVCYVDDPISLAEKLMCDNRVRRLPVIDFNDRLAGVISLDDLALQAREQVSVTGLMQVSQAAVAETLAEIARPDNEKGTTRRR
jgi:CBS domain-containing protein